MAPHQLLKTETNQCNAILDHDIGQDDAKVKKGQGCDKNKGKRTNQTGNTCDFTMFFEQIQLPKVPETL